MSAGTFGRPGEKRVVDDVAEDPVPDALQIIERSAKLRGGKAVSLAHLSQSGRCLATQASRYYNGCRPRCVNSNSRSALRRSS